MLAMRLARPGPIAVVDLADANGALARLRAGDTRGAIVLRTR